MMACFKKLLSASIALLLVSGCSKQEEAEQTTRTSAADGKAENFSAPRIDPAAAPGVAFRYAYTFLLPDTAIATVQEVHASACEKLGPNQCRITGMRYQLLDNDRVSASLEFKLAPALARSFGKEGIAAVQKAAGKLVDSEITGQDAAAKISASQQRSQSIQSQIAELERKLAAMKPNDSEREALRSEIANLRGQITQEKSAQIDSAEQLANTPMSFDYRGEGGFAFGNDPIRNAAHAGWASMTTMISAVLLGLAYGLPWAILGMILILLWRWRHFAKLRRKLFGPAPD